MTSGTVEILHIEDNPDDAMLMEMALGDCPTKFHVHHLADGGAALAFLEHAGDGSEAKPDLILTDLNLPAVSGHDLVQFVQQHESLKPIPVVVISGLAYAESARGHYQSAVACVLSKPLDGDGYQDLARQIEEVWLRSSEQPPAE